MPIQPAEAVAVVRRLCALAEDHPSRLSHPTEIVLLADGELLTATGRERRLPAPTLLTRLLWQLLDRAPLGQRPSPTLCDVVARGQGAPGTDGFQSVEALADELRRFEGPDPSDDRRALFARWRTVCDLANDLPEAAQTVRLVLLDATGTGRAVVVRKPDRRRYERVAFNTPGREVALLTKAGESPAENHRAGADAEPFAARELAFASALLLITVPGGLWFGGTLAHLVRPPVNVARSSVAAPVSNLALMASDPSTPLTEWWLSVQAEPVSYRYTPEAPMVGDGFKKKAKKARTEAKTFYRQPSPDGKRVAFDSDRGGSRAVYVVDRDGQNLRRVSGVGFAQRPIWSPDGRRLAFERAGGRGTWNLWTVEVSTGALKQVSFDSSGRPSGVSWFPKSRTLGYSHGSEVRIVDLKTGQTRRFRAPSRSRIRSLAVSPDGRRVVFTAGAEGTWLLDLPGREQSRMRRIAVDPSARAFSWAPDGQRLAYFSPRKRDWVVIEQ